MLCCARVSVPSAMWGPSPSQLLIAAVDLASPFCRHYYYYYSYHHHHHTRLSLVPILRIPYSYLTCPLFTRLRGALLSSLVALQALILFACTSVLTPEPPPPPLIVGARRAPSPPRAPHNNSSNSSTSLFTIALRASALGDPFASKPSHPFAAMASSNAAVAAGTASPTKRRAALAPLDANAMPSSPKAFSTKDGLVSAPVPPSLKAKSPLASSSPAVSWSASAALAVGKRPAGEDAAGSAGRPPAKKPCLEERDDVRLNKQPNRCLSSSSSTVDDETSGTYRPLT